jgi:hypothetical protein
VLANGWLFVENSEPHTRVAAEKLTADGQAENAGADDDEVIATHARNVSAFAQWAVIWRTDANVRRKSQVWFDWPRVELDCFGGTCRRELRIGWGCRS